MLCKKLDIIKYTLCFAVAFLMKNRTYWVELLFHDWKYVCSCMRSTLTVLFFYYSRKIKLLVLCFCVLCCSNCRDFSDRKTSMIFVNFYAFLLSSTFSWPVARYLTCCRSTTQKSIVLVVIDVYRKRSTAALRAETLIIMFSIRQQALSLCGCSSALPLAGNCANMRKTYNYCKIYK